MRIRTLLYISATLLLRLNCAAQGPIKATSAPTEVSTSPIDLMKKTVVFLQTICNEQDPSGKPVQRGYSGTAFLLMVPDDRLHGSSFTYLVTNRHVAQPGIEVNKPCVRAGYFLRADLKVPNAQGSYSQVVPLGLNALSWTFPSDASVDLAISPIGVDMDKIDAMFLPSTMLMGNADIKSNKITEGDSVLFTGLFVQLVGQIHSEPIVREGKIAMMPREQVPTTLQGLGDVYLVDCHVFGGNSGSPMFVDLSGMRGGNVLLGGPNYRLLGVVSGYVKETSGFELQTVASYAGTLDANSGIAVVVPAQELLDLINSPSLKQSRDAAVASMSK